MPHKAQLLLQLAQAAAKVETRQQGVLPSVAVNVWDTLTGNHAAAVQPAAASNRAPAAPGAGHSSATDHRGLPGGLNFLHLNGHAGQHISQAQLLAHQAATFHAWGMHSALPGSFAADTAVLYDNGMYAPAQHSLPAPLLHAAAFPGLPRPGAAAAGFGRTSNSRPGATLGSSAAAAAGPALVGGARKSRFNSSISLNKQIMNTHSARDLHSIVRSKGSLFDFFNISSAIARVPKLVGTSGGVQSDPSAKALVDDLASLMATHIDTFDARGLANSAWAFGKLKYAPNQKLPALIASAAIDKLDGFSAQNLSNLLWSFVYLHYRNQELLDAVSKQVIAKVGEFKPQELANVVWALASMEHHSPELMEVVGQRALTLLDQFKEQELSNVVWAFAKLHHYDSGMFRKLLQAVSDKLPHFLPQGVSNVAWALASAGHKDEALFERLLAHCMADIGAYDVQGLSNLLWSCATLGHKDTAFVAAATHECSARMERMSSQNLSNVLWACATLGHVDSRLLGSWAEAVMHKLDMFEPQGLSNSAWAFAKLGFSSPVLFEALAEAAAGKLEAFTPQGLSNTAWAYATVGHYHPGLMQQLAEQALQQAGSFSAINCSNTLWAFATLRHYHEGPFEALLGRLVDHLDEAEPQNVANCLYAFARVNHSLGQHTDALVSAAKRLMPQMNQQELCNTAWALGVLGQLDEDIWEEFCSCVVRTHGLTPEGVHQAFHAQLMLHSEIVRQAGVPLSSLAAEQLPTLPEPLAQHAHHMWLASAVDVHVSKLQADVSSALGLAGIPNTMEWLTDDGMFSIDIAFEVDGQNVAVEVDGNHHYTNSLPQLPLSEVVVRRRMLQDRGWKVFNVGYMEWEALPDDVSTKAAALLQLLSTELGPVSSWSHVGPPARAPGSLVAGAEAAQAAAAAAQRQQLLHQQRDLMLHSWMAGGTAAAVGTSAASSCSSSGAGTATPGLFRGAQGAAFVPAVFGGVGLPVSSSAAVPVAPSFLDAASVDLQGSWGGVSSTTNPAPGGLGVAMMPSGLGVWGSGSLMGMGASAPSPSLLQQLSQLQQQLQLQHGWDAVMPADADTATAASLAASRTASMLLAPQERRGSFDVGCSGSSIGDGVASVPPSPASGFQVQVGSAAGSVAGDANGAPAAAAGADVLPGADELQTALAAAQQKWNNSPSSTQGSGGSGNSHIKAAAFMWGDPNSASIWAP